MRMHFHDANYFRMAACIFGFARASAAQYSTSGFI
jgi:hypothetical protein